MGLEREKEGRKEGRRKTLDASQLEKKTIKTLSKLVFFSLRHTLGGCYASSFGGLVHELGHILDLAHPGFNGTADSDGLENGGIMGRGFHDIDSFFTSKYFSNSNSKGSENSGKCKSLDEFRKRQKISNLRLEVGQAFFDDKSLNILSRHR